MPAARAASSREDPSSTGAKASIRRAALASRHRAASRRRSPAPGSCRVIAIVIRALPCRRPTTDQPRQAPRGSGRDNTSGIQAVGINTHSPASLYEVFPPEQAKRLADRLEVHHTPKHGSWLNMAEIEFSALARDLPERVGNRPDLERHVAAWERRRNDAGVAADWRFTTADARI